MGDVQGIPAAWYPDPADVRRMRYWNGSAWTEQLADRPEPSPSADDYVPLARTYVAETPAPIQQAPPRTGRVLVVLATLLVVAVAAVLLVLHFLPASDEPEAAAPLVTEGMTAPFTDAQLAHLLTAEGMAEKIRYDAAQGSVSYQAVTCAPLTSTELGAQTTCGGTTRVADFDLVVQVVPDSNDAPFTVVSIAPNLH